jgi:hypothetical protein
VTFNLGLSTVKPDSDADVGDAVLRARPGREIVASRQRLKALAAR